MYYFFYLNYQSLFLQACVQMSPLYGYFQEFKLTKNMRTDPAELEFSDYILRLGEGREEIIAEIDENTVMIPKEYLVPHMNALIEKVFPKLDKKTDEV